jgi:hypothetical protein
MLFFVGDFVCQRYEIFQEIRDFVDSFFHPELLKKWFMPSTTN